MSVLTKSDRQRDRQTDRGRQRQRETETERETQTDRQRETERGRERRDTHRERIIGGYTVRQTDRQRYRQFYFYLGHHKKKSRKKLNSCDAGVFKGPTASDMEDFDLIPKSVCSWLCVR